ncbi:MAG: hypothetical protein Q9157_000549 [Trypethelium eluteriae]
MTEDGEDEGNADGEDAEDSATGNGGETPEKRFMHARAYQMEKRMGKGHRKGKRGGSRFTRTAFGSGAQICQLTTQLPPAGPQSASVTIGNQPIVTDLEKFNGPVYWYVPSMASAGQGQCETATVRHYPDAAALTAHPVIPGHPSYHLGEDNTNPKRPFVNVDHVYEVKYLGDFFDLMVDSNSFTCAQFNAFFMATDSLNQRGDKSFARLQTLWDQIPSVRDPKFAGTDSVLNMFKGKGLGAHEWKTEFGTDDEALQYLNLVAAAVDMTNIPAIAAQHQLSNQAVYNAFLGIDTLLANPQGCPPAPPQPPHGLNWADAYSSYMSSKISTDNEKVSAVISIMANDKYPNGKTVFTSTTDKQGSLNSIGKGKQLVIDLSRTEERSV